MERFLRDKALALMLLYPNQLAYQSGKSMETSLHQLAFWVEKMLDQQETPLGVFLDIGIQLTPLVAPCVQLLSDTGLATPLFSGLQLPWRAAWPW